MRLGSNMVKHDAVQLKKQPFHLAAASNDENSREVPGNERILLKTMKENISLQTPEHINRCSGFDTHPNNPNTKQPTRLNCNREYPSEYEEIKQGHGTERSRTEEEVEDNEEEDKGSKNNHQMETDPSLASQDATNQSNCFFLPGSAPDMPFRHRFPIPFPAFPPFAGDSAVKLSSIRSTDVAVAQFAENNILPTDIAVLNAVLFSLQQQQLFQMHLLQQLQQQLVCATNGTTGTTAPRSGTLLLPSKSLSVDILTSPVTSSCAAANGNRANQTFSSGDVSVNGETTTMTTTTTTGDATSSTGTVAGVVVAALDDGRGSAGSSGSSSAFSPCSSVTPIDAMIGMSTRNIPFPSDKRITDEGKRTQ